jgi:parallel beta-helix repeat protein
VSILRFRTPLRATGLATAAAAAALALVAPVSASATSVTAGKASSACGRPTYRTIQSAVNAVAAGTTIKVCPGRYAANVMITKASITLTSVSGAASATVTGTGSDTDGNTPTVQLDGAGDVVKALTVGPDRSSGEAIEIDNDQTRPTRGAQVVSSVVTGNLVVGSGAAIVKGNRLSNPAGKPSGISAFGAKVSITNNTVRPNGDTTGIYVWNSGGSVASNTVQAAGGSSIAILVAYSPGFTVGPANQVSGAGYGIEAIGERAVITRNTVANSGYGLFANSASNVTFSGNKASESRKYDCYDASSGSHSQGTANIWTANIGRTSFRPGICKP